MAAKIGILTFHCAHNYGAVLQAYATQRLLADAGYEAEVIDYRPEYLVRPYRRFAFSRFIGKDLISTLRHMTSETLMVPLRISRYSAFESFISGNLRLSERTVPGEMARRYDVVLIGSDQVWNRKITGGAFDGMYFGESDISKRYVADAVSMESDVLSAEDASYIKDHLGRFSAVSVRESHLATLLQEKCGCMAEHILDPVAQVRPQVWSELARPSGQKKPYVLVYRLRDHESIDTFVRKTADRLGAEVIEVTPFPDGRKLFKARQAVAVEDFLGLIAGASYVVTTSYHAMLFSVIFARPFTCFRFGDGRDTRQESLLKSVGLEDRMIPVGGMDVPADLSCDFTQAALRLDALRKRSSDFILNSLKETYE